MDDNEREILRWLSAPSNISGHLPEYISLDEVLDSGGQGVVYRGKFGDEDAAIKIYFPGQVSTRIKREINALKNLNCRSIVKLLWSGKVNIGDDQFSVVATSLVPGESLKKCLLARTLSDDELCKMAYDVTVAIDQMWQLRIDHRDLKPGNILIKPDGRFCVIDLGLARHLEQSTITVAGTTWGTYGYLSPEQTRCIKQLTCKSDLFTLGVILVEAALGSHPTHKDQLRLISRRLHLSLPPNVENLSIAPLIKKLLHPRPTKRPMPSLILSELKHYANQ